MAVITSKSMTMSKWMLSIIATLSLAFCLVLAVGTSSAYAANEGNPSTDGNLPAATDVAATGTATSVNVPVTSQNVQDDSMGNVKAESDNSYPGDDGSSNVFIGLEPVSTGSCDLDSLPVSRDSSSNAVYVDLEGEVGKGVDLGVAVDYMRVGQNVYDARESSDVAVQLPSETTGSYSMTSPKGGLVYTWYRNGTTPLGQGTYYTDPGTNPALGFGGSVDASSNFTEYGEEIDNYVVENNSIWGNSWPDRYETKAPYVHVQEFDGVILLPERNEIGARDSNRYMTSPLFFETPGLRTIVAQFTYAQEYRGSYGGTEYVGYVIYASNPVYFRINVKDKPTVNLNIVALDADSGASIDISGSNFVVELDKDYLNAYKAGGSEDYENLPYSSFNMKTVHDSCAYATPGLYRLNVAHETGLYREYTEYFEIAEDEYNAALADSGKAISKTIRLKAAEPGKYRVTFYDEDGTTVLLPTAQYNAGTIAENIVAPATPTKASTDIYKYVFKEWRAEVDGEGELDHSAVVYNHLYPVTCDTSYIAVYREVRIKNDAGESIVYATGGLFSVDAKPAGVLAYQLSSERLTEAEQNGVAQSHEGVIGSDVVLGMVQVDLVQYNDDASNSMTEITEHNGLDGMKLTFNMEESGINASDGDKLKVLQLHKKDEASPEEIIVHEVTVENGAVEITLNGKLSTFVFLMSDGGGSGAVEPGGSGAGESGSGESGSGNSGASGNETAGGSEGSGLEGESGEGSQGSSNAETGASSTQGGENSASNSADSSNEGGSAGQSSASSAGATPSTRGMRAASDARIEGAGVQAASHDVRPVSASISASKDGEMPATDDPLESSAIVIAAVAALAAAVGVFARRKWFAGE